MQNSEQQMRAMVAAVGVIGLVVIVIIAVAIAILICWYLSSCLKRVPPQFRRQEPGLVWLLLIPCFPIIWNFFVYPKIAESYQAYFDSVGRTDVGDCGRSLAMWYCILTVIGLPAGFVLSLIPILGPLASCVMSLATLVLWIMFLVKAGSLKGQIPLDAGGA